MPNKIFVNHLIGISLENVMQMFKKIFPNQIAAILELSAITTLKRKFRAGNKLDITDYLSIKVFHHVAYFWQISLGGPYQDQNMKCAPTLPC